MDRYQKEIPSGVSDALAYLDEQRRVAHEGFCSSLAPDLVQPDLLLSLEEERLVCRFYHTRVDEVCKFLARQAASKTASGSSQGLPRTVAPLAHSFMTRFYARRSVMATDAKHVMLACVLLASKCCHMHLSMDQFAGRIPTTNRDLLVCMETLLLSALGFDLSARSPSDCLLGLCVEHCVRPGPAGGLTGSSSQGVPASTGATCRALWLEGVDLLDRMSSTDLCLLYAPGYLARLALCVVEPSLSEKLVHEEDLQIVSRLLNERDQFDGGADAMKSLDRRLHQVRKAYL